MARKNKKRKKGSVSGVSGASGEKKDKAWLLLGGVIFLAVFLSYLPVLNAGFIWDDDTFLTENPLISAKDGLFRFWFSSEPPDYFPLTSSTLWIEWRLWGNRARGYHVVNVLLHIMSSILLWLVLRELKIPGAFLAGLIFGVHPVAVESVAWITERKNTLPMVFYMLTLYLYIRFQKTSHRGFYGFSLASFLLALLSKTSVAMLPFVLIGCAWWMKKKVTLKDIKGIVPFFIVSFALSLVTIWFQYNRAIGADVVRDDVFLSRLVIAGRAVWFYVYKAFLPIGLSFVYPRWKADVGNPASYIPVLLIIGSYAVFLWKRESWGRAFVFGWGYYLINLFPVLGFFNIYFMKYSLVADHWQYTSLAGIIALATGLFSRFLYRKDKKGKHILFGFGGLAVLIFMGMSYRQCLIYKDAESLWKDTLKKNPEAGLAHHNLAKMRQEKGRREEAIRHYRKAMELLPGDMLVPYNLANTLREQGNPQQAIEYYKKSLEINPRFYHALNNLGIAYTENGENQKALESFSGVMELEPAFIEPYINTANLMARKKMFDQAITYYGKALEIDDGNPNAHGNLGNVLAELGRHEEAIRHYEKALEADPGNPVITRNLKLALKRKTPQ